MQDAIRQSMTATEPRPTRRKSGRLATPWYLARRCQDECDRADDASFALLIVQPAEDAGLDDTQLVDALAGGLRRADVVAELGVNRYAVLLSGAGRYDAGRTASRIRFSLPRVEIGVAAFPQDGANLGELVSSALTTLRRT